MGKKKTKGSLSMQWFTTGVSTTLVLILIGLVMFFLLFAQRLSSSVKENLTVTVLVEDSVHEEDVYRIKAALCDAPYVCDIDYVSKEDALREHIKVQGSDPSEFIGRNPFTASFELHLNAPYANSDSLRMVSQSIKSMSHVSDVLYQKELVDEVNENLKRVSFVFLVLTVLLAFVSLALINNTVRLSIFSARFVIRTMKLVGASWGFIRKPFMVKSFNLGFLSALAADGLLYAGVTVLLNYDSSLAVYIPTDLMLIVGGTVMLFGLLLTLSCTFFSVNKYLRMKAGDLY